MPAARPAPPSTASAAPATGFGRVSPDDMLLFAAVAREGGIRSGAVALRAPRSTVSRRLGELETALGGRLVARSTRRFALTELGRALYAKCTELEALLRATAEVTERTAREPTGTLAVAASPIVGEEFLPEVIEAYLRRFPRVRVIVDLSVDFKDLAQGGFDLAIRNGPLSEKGSLYASRLGVSVQGHYASRAYLERAGVPETPEELREHECLVVAEGTRPVTWSFGAGRARVQVDVAGRLRVSSHRLAREAAVAGVGIARLPTVFAKGLVEAGTLVPVLEGQWPGNEIFAVHAAAHPAPPKIRAFVEMLRVAMRRHIPER